MSDLSFFSSSGSTFLVGVRVRLYLPAVMVEKEIPSRLSRSYTFGCSVMTPIEPSTAKGDATSRSATHAIM